MEVEKKPRTRFLLVVILVQLVEVFTQLPTGQSTVSTALSVALPIYHRQPQRRIDD